MLGATKPHWVRIAVHIVDQFSSTPFCCLHAFLSGMMHSCVLQILSGLDMKSEPTTFHVKCPRARISGTRAQLRKRPAKGWDVLGIILLQVFLLFSVFLFFLFLMCFSLASDGCWLSCLFVFLSFCLLVFLASCLLGFLASWLLGFLVSWLLGFLASCLLGFLSSWLCWLQWFLGLFWLH